MIGEVLYSAEDAHTWLLDSGATFHATPDIEWFSDYSTNANSVRLENGQECRIIGKDKILIWLLNGSLITMHQVHHVPNLKRSLISIDMLAEDRYKMTLNKSS